MVENEVVVNLCPPFETATCQSANVRISCKTMLLWQKRERHTSASLRVLNLGASLEQTPTSTSFALRSTPKALCKAIKPVRIGSFAGRAGLARSFFSKMLFASSPFCPIAAARYPAYQPLGSALNNWEKTVSKSKKKTAWARSISQL